MLGLECGGHEFHSMRSLIGLMRLMAKIFTVAARVSPLATVPAGLIQQRRTSQFAIGSRR